MDSHQESPTEAYMTKPFRLCGMCNRYPINWHSDGWRCVRYQGTVTPGTEACEDWIEREDWKPEPPMYSKLSDRDWSLAALKRDTEPSPADQPELEPVVYFVQCGEFIKIGFTVEPTKRIRAIKTSSPHEVRLLGTIAGGPDREKELHAMFKHLRHRGEWFRTDLELLAHIAKLTRKARKKQRT